MGIPGNHKPLITRRDFLKISILSTALLAPGLCPFFNKVVNHITAMVLNILFPETSVGWVKSRYNPVLGGSLGTCFDATLLREGDIYRMWFSWRPKKSIALVESTDGIHWNTPLVVLSPEPSSGWEEDVNRPIVLKQPDGYHMWYSAQTRGHSWIGYAISSDGKVWKRMSQDPVLSPDEAWEGGAVMCPDVIYDPSRTTYRMWYSAGNVGEPLAIGYALSPDGIRWTKYSSNPVFSPDPQSAWENDRVTACQVVLDGEWHIMFYIGFSDMTHAQIGVARSKDGISNWQRHRANPIIRLGRKGKWDEDSVYKPFTIFERDQWMLWYNGRRGGAEQIGLATHKGKDLKF